MADNTWFHTLVSASSEKSSATSLDDDFWKLKYCMNESCEVTTWRGSVLKCYACDQEGVIGRQIRRR